jgi:inositol 1,4,5-triphosphate receptor type 1/inositol 1,4,5-triphosphate receptor type 3
MLNVFQPYAAKVKDVIMQNYFIRNIIISTYSLSQYESGFLSILMFVVATFLGNFVGVEWYTIHLFDIFTDISELTNIFKAILNNFKKLALLSFLAGVFILVFNVISLNTYTPVIWEEELPAEACEDIIGCVL